MRDRLRRLPFGRSTLLVLNKIDVCHDRSLVDVLRIRHPNAVTVSARNGEGLDRLNRAVSDRLADGYVEADIETNVGNGRLLAFLAEHAEVTNRQYVDDARVVVHCRIPRAFLAKVHEAETTVRLVDAAEPEGLEDVAAIA